jgi:uroporphyrinogen decarboxylase
MKRNMTRWVEDLKKSTVKKPLPVLSFPGIQMLKVSVRDMVGSGELQARCMKAIADRYDSAASLSPMDLSVEAEAFGARVIYSDIEVPTVTGRLVDTEEEAEALQIPEVGTARTGECVRGISRAVELIADRPILAGVIGPFSLAGRLMDMTEIMIKCLVEPQTAHIVLKKATRFLISYIRAFKEAGANGIVMAEPAAGLLSPTVCAEFSSAYVRQIIDAVEDENFLVVYHNCGNTVPLVGAILSTGARVIHLGNAVRLEEVMGKYPRDSIILSLPDRDAVRILSPFTVSALPNSTLAIGSSSSIAPPTSPRSAYPSS